MSLQFAGRAAVLFAAGVCFAGPLSSQALDDLPLWSLAPTPVVLVGQLDGEPEQLLSDVRTSTLVAPDRLVVVDGGSQTLRVFDLDGRHLMTLGGEGDGPGEFRSVRWARGTAEGGLISFDYFQLRVSRFDAEGQLVDDATLRLSGVGSRPQALPPTADGHLLLRFSTREPFMSQDREPLQVRPSRETLAWYRNGERKVLGSFEGGTSYAFRQGSRVQLGNLPLRPERVVSVGSAFAAIGFTTESTLLLARPDGTEHRVSLPLAPARVTDGMWREYVREQTRNHPNSTVQAALLDLVDPPEFLPLYDDILVDSANRIWIRAFDFLPGPREWIVFRPDGRPIARIQLPEDLEVFEVAGERLVGCVTDALGVERVGVWVIS